MKKEITNEQILKKIEVGFARVDEQFTRVDEQFTRVDEQFAKARKERVEAKKERMEARNERSVARNERGVARKERMSLSSQIQSLTIMTKMGFDDQAERIEKNRVAIDKLNHKVAKNADHLVRVEITMNQEFAAATQQRGRIRERLDNHEERICLIEASS